MSALPKIVMVGRTNVGKSTLFNRLTSTKRAIVSPIAGTTRDTNVGIVEWDNFTFQLIDTGGLDLSEPNDIEKKVFDMAWRSIEAADLVLLIVDSKQGLLPHDESIAKQLREKHVPFAIVANKADSPSLRMAASDFMPLHKEVISVSAANGTGTGDLLDYINTYLFGKASNKTVAAEKEAEQPQEQQIAITFAGLPNVGKSSLMNALLGREEVIVSPVPHTTRETRDVDFEFEGRSFKLVDTAGIRKAQKLRTSLVRESADRSLEALRKTDWVIMVVDATAPSWGEQEHYILDSILRTGANVLIAANKWDLLESEDRYKEFRQRWESHFGHYPWIPVIPISAKSGWHITRLMKQILALDENRHREIPQSALDRLLKKAIARRRPQKKKGPEAPYIHAIKQIGTQPPVFEVVIDYDDTLANFYVRYLMKVIRSQFEFTATPIRISVRAIR